MTTDPIRCPCCGSTDIEVNYIDVTYQSDLLQQMPGSYSCRPCENLYISEEHICTYPD